MQSRITSLSKKSLLKLADDIQKGDEKAVKRALIFKNKYLKNKELYNKTFSEMKKEDFEKKGDEKLAGEFFGRFCRCLVGMKSENPTSAEIGRAIAICSSSIYKSRGLKGVDTKRMQCNYDIARAEKTILSVKQQR